MRTEEAWYCLGLGTSGQSEWRWVASQQIRGSGAHSPQGRVGLDWVEPPILNGVSHPLLRQSPLIQNLGLDKESTRVRKAVSLPLGSRTHSG